MKNYIGCIAMVILGVGCASSDGKPVGENVGIEAPAGHVLFSRTVVELNLDGTAKSVKVDYVTPEQQAEWMARGAELQKLVEQGLAPAVTRDTTCNQSTSNWYYDGWTGSACSGNQICFTGTGGPVDLSGFTRGANTWGNAIVCIQANETNGHFRDASLGGGCGDFSKSSTQRGWSGVNRYLYQGSSCCTGTNHWCECSLCEDSSGCTTISSCLGPYCGC